MKNLLFLIVGITIVNLLSGCSDQPVNYETPSGKFNMAYIKTTSFPTIEEKTEKTKSTGQSAFFLTTEQVGEWSFDFEMSNTGNSNSTFNGNCIQFENNYTKNGDTVIQTTNTCFIKINPAKKIADSICFNLLSTGTDGNLTGGEALFFSISQKLILKNVPFLFESNGDINFTIDETGIKHYMASLDKSFQTNESISNEEFHWNRTTLVTLKEISDYPLNSSINIRIIKAN